MIASVQFRNFKVLRDTTLPLGRFTLLVGPNGSGKSTAMQALQAVADPERFPFHRIVTAGLQPSDTVAVEVILRWGAPYDGTTTITRWERHSRAQRTKGTQPSWDGIRIYALHANRIASATRLRPSMVLQEDGAHLAGVLDRLRDRAPERFEALNDELARWFPEFDRILFDTPAEGTRAFLVRMRHGHHAIPAEDLSQGTLLALAILTLAYIPDLPPMIGFEEPDRGMHPRLLRDVQDALYRLSYPENFGETRAPVQVLATTHSPYFLDLFKDHPEEIVIAHKHTQEARFERLSDRPDIDEILADAPLGEVWYSGILGGVPVEP